MAAEWNADAEIGGAWTTAVQRLASTTAGHVALPLAEPCTLALWRQGLDPAVVAPTLSVSGVLASGLHWARITITAAQLSALGIGIYEHRLTLADPSAGPIVMARGWFVIRGRKSDL
jgi:hypothetical protein